MPYQVAIRANQACGRVRNQFRIGKPDQPAIVIQQLVRLVRGQALRVVE